MAEKWDGSANDSPEVVYEGFSPPPTHHQGMISTASSSFVAADGNEDGSLGGAATAFMQTGPIVENQGEGSHHEEIERSRLCFVCCNPVSDKNYESIKASMNHSHAPLLVLLTDVLGYKLEEGRLHSQVVCKACYHLLDIIDELQQTLTESKTDVRTKFLETIQKLRLKYPRTDKMLKPRCLRCIQMSQTTARKRGRGRGWKGRSDDIGRGRGRGGRGRGRPLSRSEDGHDVSSDNDTEGQEVSGEEVMKDALPSKSRQLQSYEDDAKMNEIVQMRVEHGCPVSILESDKCSDPCVGTVKPVGPYERKYKPDLTDTVDSFDSVYKQTLSFWLDEVSPCEYIETFDNSEDHTERECSDCSHLQFYECCLCKGRTSQVFYQYCETCMTCHGTFIPWGCDINLEFIDDKCSVCDLKINSHQNQGKMHVVSQGSKLTKHFPKAEIVGDKCHIQSEMKIDDWNMDETLPVVISGLGKAVQENDDFSRSDKDLTHSFSTFETDPTLKITPIKEEMYSEDSDKTKSTIDKVDEVASVESLVCQQAENGKNVHRNLITKKVDTESRNSNTANSFFKSSAVLNILNSGKTLYSENIDTTALKTDLLQSPLACSTSLAIPDQDNTLTGTESVTCLTDKDMHTDDSYVVVSEAFPLSQDSDGPLSKHFVSNYLYYKEIQGVKCRNTEDESSQLPKSRVKAPDPLKVGDKDQDLRRQSEKTSVVPQDKKTLADLFTEMSNRPSLGKRKRKLTEKAKEIIADGVDILGTDRRVRKNLRIAKNTETVSHKGDAKNCEEEGYNCKYICEYCGKKFNSYGGFRYHVDSHEIHKAKIYACSFCIYTTRRQADLRKHNVIHTGEKHYKCEICGQDFSVNSSYKRHLRIHSGVKPYKCTVCGRDFRNSGTLKQHMVKHTGARNFVCEVCGGSFSLRHHYTAHRKLHSGEMPFKCLYCRSTFRNHSALKRHRKKNHPKEEASRLKQIKLKRAIVREDPGGHPSPGVIQGSVDVLEQAMAATVDPVTYEYVDSYTQTLPDTDNESAAPIVSEIITENFSGKESVVLAVTHIEDGEISKETIVDNNCSSVEELQESHAALVSVDDCQEQDKTHQTVKVYPGSFCSEDTVNLSQEYMMVKDDQQSVQGLKSESIEVMSSNRSEASQMYIMLSDAHAQDPHLYIVVKNDDEAVS